MKQYENNIYQFKRIEPSKMYSDFTYYDIEWNNVSWFHCENETILKIDGLFYQYTGIKSYTSSHKIESEIRFYDKKKIIKKLKYLDI